MADRDAILQRAQAALDATADIEEQIAGRARRQHLTHAAALPVEGPKFPLAQQTHPAPFVPRAAPRAALMGRNWDAEQKWVEQIFDQRKKAGIEATGIAIARVRKQLRDEVTALAEEIGKDVAALNARIAKSEAAVTELLMDQEKRLVDLERRLAGPNRPRLIAGGGSDAG